MPAIAPGKRSANGDDNVARIAGVDLPDSKRIEAGLCYIHGIGPTLSKRILRESGVDPDARGRDLTESEVSRLSAVITSSCKVEGDLRRDVQQNIKRLMDIGCYRGLRHRRGLPVRGQRTRTNARSRKGPKRTVGAKRAT
jgi:small subunit ribosomal protein S13